MSIIIDRERNKLIEDFSLDRLKEGYLSDTDTDAQDRFAFVSEKFSSNPEHAQRLYDYSSKKWLSFATPILAYGRNKKGLPISCFASFLDDSMESILETSSETRVLSVVGGGVGLHVGLRPKDKKSSGIIPHLKTYDVDTLAFKQGTTRRGATAAYISINHPEIQEFIEMRKPTGGDPNRKCLNLHHGINVTDDFMRRIEALSTNDKLTDAEKETLDKFPLVNPNTGKVEKFVSAKQLWQQILDVRLQTGEPYLWFIDTVNNALPEAQKNLGLTNKGSNLCLTGDTIVQAILDEEHIEIALVDLVEMFQMGRTDIKVLGGQTLDYFNISAAAQTGITSELIEIEDEAGNIIRCTPEHQIFTKNRGYVMAKDLCEDDVLVNA